MLPALLPRAVDRQDVTRLRTHFDRRPSVAPRSSTRRVLTLLLAAATAGALVTTSGTAAAADNPWTRVDNGAPASRSAQQGDVRAAVFAGFTLDRSALASTLAGTDTVEVVLPTPAGTFERFEVVDTPVMEPGLAAKHPDIRTFTGRSLEDPTASVRADLRSEERRVGKECRPLCRSRWSPYH